MEISHIQSPNSVTLSRTQSLKWNHGTIYKIENVLGKISNNGNLSWNNIYIENIFLERISNYDYVFWSKHRTSEYFSRKSVTISAYNVV